MRRGGHALVKLVLTTQSGETRLDVGAILLIDPSGVVYDEALYAGLLSDGATPAAARCGGALTGASVTIQRRVGGRFVTLAPGRRSASRPT